MYRSTRARSIWCAYVQVYNTGLGRGAARPACVHRAAPYVAARVRTYIYICMAGLHSHGYTTGALVKYLKLGARNADKIICMCTRARVRVYTHTHIYVHMHAYVRTYV